MTAPVNVPCARCGTDRWTTPNYAARAKLHLCRQCAQSSQFRMEVMRRLHKEYTAAQACVDDMAVERLLMGMPVNSTRAERQAAVVALTARQLSARAIAERLRVSQRTVNRMRARERVAA